MTRVVAVEAEETTLQNLAAMLEAALDAVCADIELDGGEIVGAASVAPASATYTQPIEGSYRDDAYRESGLVAVVTYRVPVDEPEG